MYEIAIYIAYVTRDTTTYIRKAKEQAVNFMTKPLK